MPHTSLNTSEYILDLLRAGKLKADNAEQTFRTLDGVQAIKSIGFERDVYYLCFDDPSQPSYVVKFTKYLPDVRLIDVINNSPLAQFFYPEIIVNTNTGASTQEALEVCTTKNTHLPKFIEHLKTVLTKEQIKTADFKPNNFGFRRGQPNSIKLIDYGAIFPCFA